MWKVQVVHNLLRKSVIFPSVRPCAFVYTRGSRRGATNRGARSADVAAAARWAASILSCCGNVWTEDAGVLVQSKLETVALHPSWAVLTETPVNCGCPWPIQACFSSTRWVIVGFILLLSDYAACTVHQRTFRYDEAEESGASLGRLEPHWESFTSECGSFVIRQWENAWLIQLRMRFIAQLEQQMTAPPNTSTGSVFAIKNITQ